MIVNFHQIIRPLSICCMLFMLVACNGEEAAERSKQTLEPLTVEELQGMLPAAIAGTRATPHSGGRQTSEGRVLMKAAGEYLFNGGGYIRVSVTDFTDLEDYTLPYRSQYDNFSANSTEGFSTIKNSNGIGVEQWDPGERSGTVRFLALDRFGVVIEIMRMPKESIHDARGILESLNFNALRLKM